MSKISREKFIEICNNAIKKTREAVIIANQISGYKEYHKAIRDTDFFITMRTALEQMKDDYLSRHDLIGQLGLGNCKELTHYLAVEIGQMLEENDAEALIKLVVSDQQDHGYLRITISLEGENVPSKWEVEAWDPRVIDITRDEDLTINNRKKLAYGYNVTTYGRIEISTNKHQFFPPISIEQRKNQPPFSTLCPPERGVPQRAPTPDGEILGKHKHIKPDYTIAQAYNDGKLCLPHQLSELQQGPKKPSM